MEKTIMPLGKTVLHQPVRNIAGERLGRIEDVAVDPETGNIQYAILSFGGALGIGNKLFPIPWSELRISPSRDYLVFDIDQDSIKDAPAFQYDAWPKMADPVWNRNVHEDNGRTVTESCAHEKPTVSVERRTLPARRGTSLLGEILIVGLLLGAVWVGFLVSTRGWDQAGKDIKSSLQSAAYAAKETSHDAALTTKVKTALSLSKRIPAQSINVDSEGDAVTLRGDVPSAEIRDLAESIAREVPGVSEVHNHLYAETPSK